MPTFRSQVQNSFPDCLEVTFDEGQGTTPYSVVILTDLRCGLGREIYGNYTTTFCVTYAEVRLAADCPTKVRSRYGDRALQNETEENTATTEVDETETQGNALLKLGPSIAASLGLSRRAAREKTRKQQATTFSHRVRAKGDMKWDVSEIDGTDPLKGRYIGEDPLCILESDTPIKNIRLRILIPKRSFTIHSVTDNESGEAKALSLAKRRVLEVLTSRSLDQEGDGLIIASGALELIDAPE